MIMPIYSIIVMTADSLQQDCEFKSHKIFDFFEIP